jgi:hypothetical protein
LEDKDLDYTARVAILKALHVEWIGLPQDREKQGIS